jgi:RHS repeat-associated protein
MLRKLLFSLAVLSCMKGMAARENNENTLTGTGVLPLATFSVQDNQYLSYPSPSGFTNVEISNSVSLMINHQSGVYVPNKLDYTFHLQVVSEDESLVSATSNISLRVVHDPAGGTARDKHVHLFSGMVSVAVTILSIDDNLTGLPVAAPAAVFMLRAEVNVERYYHMSLSASPLVAISGAVSSGVTHAYDVNWSLIPGAEEYQLEWTYVNSYTNASGTYNYTGKTYNFRSNSTRITTSASSYRISNVFDRGALVVRVRAVGRHPGNFDRNIYGTWSIFPAGGPLSALVMGQHYANIVPHELSLNWQYSAAYAEEGKKKEVVSYFDGSLRSRQQVTKNNTDNEALVGESFYDHQGRKALDALPVPAGTEIIRYFPGFNKNTSLLPYSRVDFDLDASPGSCSVSSAPFSPSSGAEQYYSSTNPVQTDFNAYLPEANGFPYIRTEYTPDNTGRIRRQGGAGDTHQLNSGHESRYFYAKPLQVELDRLFGSEAGYARFYKKDMVIDPNGQISISYTDLAGKVVATALSGESPAPVSTLPSYGNAGDSIVADLLEKDALGNSTMNRRTLEGDGLIFNTALVVATSGMYSFDYTLTAPAYENGCLLSGICFDCSYDLYISITDDCGNVVGEESVYVGGPALDTECEDPLVTFSSSGALDVNLGVGNYQVTKILKINKAAFDYYLSVLLDSAQSCYKTLNEFIADELMLVDTSGCELSCDECAELLGTRDEFVLAGYGSEADWEVAYKGCMEPCAPESSCENFFRLLLSDVSPGGQYAQWYDTSEGRMHTAKYPLSLFNFYNFLPDGGLASDNGGAYWRNPDHEGFGAGYYSESGVRVKIRVNVLPSGNMPETHQLLSDAGGFYTWPEQLVHEQDFIYYWQPYWAYSLVKYHPEYCYYQWCRGNQTENFLYQSSDGFDNHLAGTNSYSQAVSLGWLTSPLEEDPYFATGGRGSAQYTEMLNVLQSVDYQETGMNIYEFSASSARCPGHYATSVPPSCKLFGTGSDTNVLNAEWIVLKSIYLSEKLKLQEKAVKNFMLAGGDGCNLGVNTCIGAEHYNPFLDWDYTWLGDAFVQDLTKPCSWLTWHLYKIKERRYQFQSDATAMDQADAEYNIYYNSGKCPEFINLETMLKTIVQEGTLLDTFGLYNKSYLTADLYRSIHNGGSSSVYTEYTYTPSVDTSNALQIRFVYSLIASPCSLVMGLPPEYTWNQVVGIRELIPMGGAFDAVLLIDTDNDPQTPPVELLVSGSTSCFNSCAFETDCRPSLFAHDLMNLMSQLAHQGNLNSTSPVDLEDPDFSIFFTSVLRRALLPNTSDLVWQMTADDTIRLRSTDPLQTFQIKMFIDAFDPVSFTLGDLDKITYFESIRPDPQSQNHFLMQAYYDHDNNPSTPAIPLVLKIYIDRKNYMGLCNERLPVTCQTPAHVTAMHLVPFLAEAVISPPAYPVNLSSRASFSAHLKGHLGLGEYQLSVPEFYEDSITFDIMSDEFSPGHPYTLCKLKIYRSDPYFEEKYSLEDIVGIEGLEVDNDILIDGQAYGFTVFVRYANGGFEKMTGYSSCFPVKSCGCSGAGGGGGGGGGMDIDSVCTLEYDTYVEAVGLFNTNYYGNNPVSAQLDTVDIEDYDCDCGRDYIAYLRGYTGGGTPLSMEAYCADECGKKKRAYERAVHLHNMNNPLRMVSLRPVNEICDCIDAYIAYLENLGPGDPVKDIITFYNDGDCDPPGPCESDYQLYLSTVSQFNTNGFENNPAFFQIVPVSQSSFDCNCALEYMLYLMSHAHGNLVLTMEQYCSGSGGGCGGLEAAYIKAVYQHNMNNPANQVAVKPSGELCNCLAAYIAYLSGLLPGQAALDLFEFSLAGGCGDRLNCLHNFMLMKQAMLSFNNDPVRNPNGHTILPGGGTITPQMCDCMLAYVNYLNSLSQNPGDPLPMSLHDFINGELCSPIVPVEPPVTVTGDNSGYFMQMFSPPLAESQVISKSVLYQRTYTGGRHCGVVPFLSPVQEYRNRCAEHLRELARQHAQHRHKKYEDSLIAAFQESYYERCLGGLEESFEVEYFDRTYHYTLYYYDQAGNLIRTVPPAGVRQVTNTQDFNTIRNDRTFGTRKFFTGHTLVTVYEYNSLNQLVKQHLPDHDLMDRWHVGNAAPGGNLPSGFIAYGSYAVSSSSTVVVGEIGGQGCMFRSDDGGIGWYRVGSIETSGLLEMQMVTSMVGYAVGKEGLLYKTTDGGANWMILPAGMKTMEQFNDLYFKDVNNGVAVGNNGAIRITSDGGASWTSSGSSVPGNITAVTGLSSTALLLTVNNGGEGRVYYSSDFGNTWVRRTAIRSEDLSCVQMLNSQDGYAVGIDGILLKTSDGGVSWVLLPTEQSRSFKAIYFRDVNRGFAILEESGGDGKIWKTSNGGRTWLQASTLGTYTSFSFYSQNEGYAIGKSGGKGILARLDAFDLKVAKLADRNDLPAVLEAVYFSDADNGYAAGAGGAIYYTNNASSPHMSWTVITATGAAVGKNFRGVFFHTGSLGVLLSAGGELIRYDGSAFTDVSGGGSYTDLKKFGSELFVLDNSGRSVKKTAVTNLSSYTTVHSLSGANDLYSLSVISASVVVSVGQHGAIFRAASSRINSVSIPELYDIYASSSSVAYMVGADGRAYKTSNSGTGWALQPTYERNDYHAVRFYTSSAGLIGGKGGTVLKTTNGGTSFTRPSVSSDETVLDIDYLSSTQVALSGSNGLLRLSSNGGTSWTPAGFVPEAGDLNAVAYISGSLIATTGSSGIIWNSNGSSLLRNKQMYTPVLRSVHFSGMQGIAAGEDGLVLRSEDGGTNWSLLAPVSLPVADHFSSWRKGPQELFVTDDQGKLYYSANRGISWSSQTLAAGKALRGIAFNGDNQGLVAGEDGTILYTVNGGLAWTASSSGVTDDLNAVHLENHLAFVAGDNGVLLTSSNIVLGGWNSENTGTSENLHDIYMHDYYTGYVLGDNGTLRKTINGGTDWSAKANHVHGQPVSADHLYTAAFNTRFDGYFGGAGYHKRLKDEADLFSGYFYYDKLGRLTASENTKQFNRTNHVYSYTLFDYQGRITEVGEMTHVSDVLTTYSGRLMDDGLFSAWLGSASSRREVTATYYDFPISGLSITGFAQENIRKRVASSTYEEVYDADPETYDNATHYTYDIHGNVRALVQDIPELSSYGRQHIRMDYEYDLISGNVNAFHYQTGQKDQWHHRYVYDADNRIQEVYTSRDNITWDRDAKYRYYRHGPLARTELGDIQVQGIDYAYTLSGWLKGVNGTALTAGTDIGGDGFSPGIRQDVARDAFGYSLGYYSGDYSAISGLVPGTGFFLPAVAGSDLQNNRSNLYNGNISMMITSITDPNTGDVLPQGYAYKYDQLNRLKQMRAFSNYNPVNNSFGYTGTVSMAYGENFSYDANGNILTLDRRGTALNLPMDSMRYHYDYIDNDPLKGLNSNRLYHVRDAVSSSYSDDIDDQGAFTPGSSLVDVNQANNYGYDETGNLIRDDAEGIAGIEWTVTGKVRRITRTLSSSGPDLEFIYDAGGQRIAKIEKPKPLNPATEKVTWYLRDAQGNPLVMYDAHVNNSQQYFIATERVIYGSSRLGTDTRKDTILGPSQPPVAAYKDRLLGAKLYEGTNHLGNVLVTFTDKKIAHDDNADNITDYYTAAIRSSYDYYSFGSPMPERTLHLAGVSCSTSTSYSTSSLVSNGHTNVWSSYMGGTASYNPSMLRQEINVPSTGSGAFYTLPGTPPPLPGSSATTTYTGSVTVESKYNTATVAVYDQWGVLMDGPYAVMAGIAQAVAFSFTDNGSSGYQLRVTGTPPSPGTFITTTLITGGQMHSSWLLVGSASNWYNAGGNWQEVTVNNTGDGISYAALTPSAGEQISMSFTVQAQASPVTAEIYQNGISLIGTYVIAPYTTMSNTHVFNSSAGMHELRLTGSPATMPVSSPLVAGGHQGFWSPFGATAPFYDPGMNRQQVGVNMPGEGARYFFPTPSGGTTINLYLQLLTSVNNALVEIYTGTGAFVTSMVVPASTGIFALPMTFISYDPTHEIRITSMAMGPWSYPDVFYITGLDIFSVSLISAPDNFRLLDFNAVVQTPVTADDIYITALNVTTATTTVDTICFTSYEDGYRFGFNGKEKDNEVSGSGNQYDYGFRIYNPRLGRFLSVDPLFRSYPFYSPYQFAGNMPIAAVDLDGLEIYFAANGNYIGKWGTSTEIKVINNDRVQEFQNDLKAANNNPNDWIKQDVMNFYWSGAAGSRSPSTTDKNAISKEHVIPTSTHESYSTHGDCYKSACATLSNNNYEPGSYWGDKDYQYQMYKAGNTPNVDIAKTRLAGFEKINSELEAGRPLLIGVDYHSGNSNPNTDKTTDHFIVLTGRGFDNDGNLFYTGFENVDGGSNSDGTSTTQNRFYPQADGTLQGGTTYTGGMTITQVRPVKEKK